MGKSQPDLHLSHFINLSISSPGSRFSVYLYQATVEELEHTGEEDVGEISVNYLQLPGKKTVPNDFYHKSQPQKPDK